MFYVDAHLGAERESWDIKAQPGAQNADSLVGKTGHGNLGNTGIKEESKRKTQLEALVHRACSWSVVKDKEYHELRQNHLIG